MAPPAATPVITPAPMAAPTPATYTPPARTTPPAPAAGFDQAESILRQISNAPERTSDQDAAAKAAYDAALAQNQVPAILRDLLSLLQTYPNSSWSTEACLQIARFAGMNNRQDLAVLAYRAYLLRRPPSTQTADVRLLLGDALRRVERYEEAIREYQTVMRQDTSGQVAATAQDGMAASLMALARYEEAVAEIESLLQALQARPGQDIRSYPNLPVLLLNEGLCLEELGRYQEAVNRYGTLRELLPDSKEAELAQARLYDLSRPILSISTGTAGATGTIAAQPAPNASVNRLSPGMTNRFEAP